MGFPKLLIVGIDGGTLDLIRPWAREGKLPVFKRLLETGVQADLRSTVPPVTPTAWTSLMTGRNPGKHGLFHFIEFQPGSYDLRYTNARSRLCDTVWKTLNESGYMTGVINVPMTYPPEPVQGFMISGLDTPFESKECTHPAELYSELKTKFGRVSPQIQHLGNLRTNKQRNKLLKDVSELDNHFFKLADYLLRISPVDVAMVVFTSIDTLQHFFWHYLDESHPKHDAVGATRYHDAILKGYQRVETYLDHFLNMLPKEASIVLLSDHGFRAFVPRTLFINRILEEHGFLTFREGADKSLHPNALLSKLLKRMDAILRKTLTSRQKARIAGRFPVLRKKWESRLTNLPMIDWNKTKAYAHETLFSSSGIFVNVEGLRPLGSVRPGPDYERTVDSIVETLYRLRDPLSGKKLLNHVYRREEIYWGPFAEHAPDLIIPWWDDPTLIIGHSSRLRTPRRVVEYDTEAKVSSGQWTGTHSLNGLLVMCGPPFESNKKLSEAHIIDIAPTILYLLGVPIPTDMDGSILFDAIRDDVKKRTRVSKRKGGESAVTSGSERTYTDEEAETIRARLKSLGYIE